MMGAINEMSLALAGASMTEKNPFVCFAETEEDFSYVEAIWREVYCQELGWLQEEHCKLQHDKFHPYSKYVLARDRDGQPVGVMRLVLNGELGLPIEQFVDISDIKRTCQGRIIECARLMVPQRCRDVRIEGFPFGVYATLVKATLHYSMQNGIYDVMANCFKNTETTPIKSLLLFGFNDLGMEFRDDLNEASSCTALHLDIRNMLARMYAKNRKFNCYMIAHDDSFNIYS